MEQESTFSPSSAYQQGILALQEKSQLQNFLQFYARYQLNLKNSVLLYLASLQNPTAGQARTMEEWNQAGRKIRYGEKSSLHLYAPENFHGRTRTMEQQEMVPLFREDQTEPSEQYRRNDAEHPFHLEDGTEIPEASAEEMLQICVNTAIGFMRQNGWKMPVFVEPSAEIPLENPVRFDPRNNQLCIAKGAAYDDVAFAMMREVIYSKQYRHAQQPEFYLGIRQKAAYAAQAAAYQMGIRKEFPLEIPEMPQAEQCLQSIPDGIQSLQEDWIWISQQMKLERQGAAVQATPTEAEQRTGNPEVAANPKPETNSLPPELEEVLAMFDKPAETADPPMPEPDIPEESSTPLEPPSIDWDKIFPDDPALAEQNRSWDSALNFGDLSEGSPDTGRKRSQAAEL